MVSSSNQQRAGEMEKGKREYASLGAIESIGKGRPLVGEGFEKTARGEGKEKNQ